MRCDAAVLTGHVKKQLMPYNQMLRLAASPLEAHAHGTHEEAADAVKCDAAPGCKPTGSPCSRGT